MVHIQNRIFFLCKENEIMKLSGQWVKLDHITCVTQAHVCILSYADLSSRFLHIFRYVGVGVWREQNAANGKGPWFRGER